MQDKHSSQIFTSIQQSEAPLHGIEVSHGHSNPHLSFSSFFL